MLGQSVGPEGSLDTIGAHGGGYLELARIAVAVGDQDGPPHDPLDGGIIERDDLEAKKSDQRIFRRGGAIAVYFSHEALFPVDSSEPSDEGRSLRKLTSLIRRSSASTTVQR